MLGRILFSTVSQHVDKEEIRSIMNQMIPECKDSETGVCDLFVEYFYEVTMYQDRKPGIYTEFDSHMKRVIIVEFYKRIIRKYRETIVEQGIVCKKINNERRKE